MESGGNCEISEFGKTVVKHGVTIVGEANMPSLLPINASELYAKNISTLLLHLATKDGFKWKWTKKSPKGASSPTRASWCHGFTKEILSKSS